MHNIIILHNPKIFFKSLFFFLSGIILYIAVYYLPATAVGTRDLSVHISGGGGGGQQNFKVLVIRPHAQVRSEI